MTRNLCDVSRLILAIGILSLPGLAYAQTEPIVVTPSSITRPAADKIIIEFDKDLPADNELEVVIFTPDAKIFPIKAKANQSKTITLDLPAGLASEIERFRKNKRVSRLYIPEQALANNAILADSMNEVPTGLGEVLIGKVSNNMLPITVLPNFGELDAQLDEERAWSLVDKNDNTIKYEVTEVKRVSTVQGGFQLFLDRKPKRGSEVNLFFNTGTMTLKVGTFKGAGALAGTETDPLGNADAYIGTNLAASAGKTPVFGLDLRGRPIIAEHFSKGARTYYRIMPSWDIKVNSSQLDDENSMKLGLRFEGLKLVSKSGAEPLSERLLSSITFNATPMFEADKKFRNTNFVLDSDARFNFIQLGQARTVEHPHRQDILVRLRAFGGLTVGRSVNNVIPQLEGNPIVRLKAGADFSTRFSYEKRNLKHITFLVNYTHVQLLRDELFTASKEEKLAGVNIPPPSNVIALGEQAIIRRLLLLTQKKGPHNYVNLRLLYGFTDQFDLNFSYVYGELAPTFQRVNKFQMGFGYRFNF